MKAIYFVQPVENKKRGFFSFFRKDKVRTVLISQFGFSYYAFDEDAKLLKLTLPADADPAEIAMRIAEQQKQIEKKNKK